MQKITGLVWSEGATMRVVVVGDDGIAKIERREENLGEYGIVWFDVFNDTGVLVVSFNAKTVSVVEYDWTGDPEGD